MSLNDGMRGLFGEAPDPFGFDFGLGGVADYLPGQESAFNPEALRQILSGAIQEGLSGISPMIGGKTEDQIAQDVAEFLSKNPGLLGTIAGSTVGSNQMLDDAALAAAQAATQPEAAAQETVDLTEDTTAPTITGGLGDGSLGDAADLGTVDQGAVSDAIESWKYDKSSDSFISTVNGDVVKRTGDPDVPLRDGGEYYVRGVEGTDGVTAEHVIDTETKESVGIFNIDINTGLPSIIKSVDTGSTVDNGSLDNGGVGDTGIGDTGVSDGGVGSGDDFNTARDTSNIGKVLTVGSTPSTGTSTVTKGADGKDGTDGQDGRDGRDGKDGKDGKDGMIGLFSSIQNTPITESILFTPKFTKLENVQQGMFDAFLRAAGGNR